MNLAAISTRRGRCGSLASGCTETLRRMSRIRFVLALALLLVFAQQGAVLHELSHVYRTGAPALESDATLLDGKMCEACLAFAQAANPATGTLLVAPIVAAVRHVSPETQYSIIATTAPTPRSRGPPILL
jgi:hypothetical protein